MRVVLEYDNGEIWGQHEIEGVAAAHLLELISEPSKENGREGQAAVSLVKDLRGGSLAEISLSQESEQPAARGDFTRSELFILSEALESYWFDCSQGGDDDLKARKPAIEALSAKIEQVLCTHERQT